MAKVDKNTGVVEDDATEDDVQNAVEVWRRLTNIQLSEIGTSQEELEQFLADIGLTVDDAVFVASEFALTDKADLVDVPLFFIQWNFKMSENYVGSEYAIVHGVRMDTGTKVVFADGGTGIRDQLQLVTGKRSEKGLPPSSWQAGLAIPNGLVRSDYGPGLDRDGNERPGGTTYYLG